GPARRSPPGHGKQPGRDHSRLGCPGRAARSFPRLRRPVEPCGAPASGEKRSRPAAGCTGTVLDGDEVSPGFAGAGTQARAARCRCAMNGTLSYEEALLFMADAQLYQRIDVTGLWQGWRICGRCLVSPDGERISPERLRGLAWSMDAE